MRLPSLRERSDLGVVARRILQAECPQATPQISPSVMVLFGRYAWPGNIRQLANVLRTAAVMATGEPQITEAHLSDDFLEDAQQARGTPPVDVAGDAPAPLQAPPELAVPPLAPVHAQPPLAPVAPPQPERARGSAAARTLGEAEIEMIREVLAAAHGNISEASKRLGISRNTIYRKLRWGKGG